MYLGIGTITGTKPVYHIRAQLYVIFGAVIDSNRFTFTLDWLILMIKLRKHSRNQLMLLSLKTL